MYRVKHHAYCGMAGLPHEFQDRGDARDYVAARLRATRAAGYPVTTLTTGEEWEILEPDDCHMVPDACGTLTLREKYKYECRECGTGHDDREEAAMCCGYGTGFNE